MLFKKTGQLFIGKPINKELYKWITKIDLEKYDILVKSPIAVRNFLTQYTNYKSDFEQFGQSEYWQDSSIILETRNDDCEGLNNLACSILYTLDFDCRLAIGCYNINNPNILEENRTINHAYGLLFDNDDIFIIECTGDDLIEELPLLKDHPEYYTHFMGSAIEKANYKCNHRIK